MKRFFMGGFFLLVACEGAVDLGGTSPDGTTGDGGTALTETKTNDGASGKCCPPSIGGCADLGGYQADGDCSKGKICDNMCEQQIVDDVHGCKKLVSKTPPVTTTYASAESCKMPVFNGCKFPYTKPLIPPGGTLSPRPSESTLRFNLTYQARAIWIDTAKGLDGIVAPSTGPFKAGVNSGYWYTLEDSGGKALYTQLFQDPTRLEGPPPQDGDGGFVNVTRPLCDAKAIQVELPNDPNGHALVIYGSPYGTQAAASELGRFTL